MAKRTQQVNPDFAFFLQLLDFYKQNRGKIRRNYRTLTKRFLDYNDPSNANTFLRQPQFEALEVYIFLKEYLDNAPVHKLFEQWAENKGKFHGRIISDSDGQSQLDIFQEISKEQYDAVFKFMHSHARSYANYIFALTMGVGKTILMATCIFYEFLLANKFPKDEKYCHNALIFAPDKTVLQSLKEIQTFDKSKIIPPEYLNFLNSNLKFHFLEDSNATLTLIEKSRFNIVVSNTQKIILKHQSKDSTPVDQIFNSGQPTYEANSVYEQYADLYADEPNDEQSLITNQRFEKLRRVTQLGIYIDEAHHAFGNQLATDMGIKKRQTSLRTTVDELATSLEQSGTRVVACYNFTGTPYVGNQILPEVVYAFGLKEAINKQYLKKVRVNGYSNTRTEEFVRATISDFLKQTQDKRFEGMLPKLAFFATTIEELQKELKPRVEKVLAEYDIPISRILVNVGDSKQTTNDEIREFNRLDTATSEKQFILLVNKGREGWNCRSLFGVALFRQPSSKIFVLQATMRCLRSITDAQQTAQVYLSEDNKETLEQELQQNFRVSIADVEDSGKTSEPVNVEVCKQEKIKLQRVRRQFVLNNKVKDQKSVSGINLELDEAFESSNLDKYRLIHTEQEGLDFRDAIQSKKKIEDITSIRNKRQFSEITLIAEIARYLNKSPIFLEEVIAATKEGTEKVLEAVNEFNELLYDWIIPRLFKEFYEIDEYQKTEEYEVELVKLSQDGYYQVSAEPDKIVRHTDANPDQADKSFHLNPYCFDSNPERDLFWQLLQDQKVNKIYFTGMLTHGQSDFYIQYIDPESHTIRSYYPDFLMQKNDGTYVIIEVKGDNMIDDPIVQAKKEFAEQMVMSSGMVYRIIKGSEVNSGQYQDLFI